MNFTEIQQKNIAVLLNASQNESVFFICSLLAIVGGECAWVPVEESCRYDKKRLKKVFSFLSSEEIDKWSNCKDSDKFAFFSMVYGPTKRGKGFLGNLTDHDGGAFYGRGFIQLTGRENYEKVGNKCGIDFVNFPHLLTNPQFSAVAAVEYLKLRMKKNDEKITDSKEYFMTMERRVNQSSIDDGKKLEYFSWFLSPAGQKFLQTLREKY